MFKVGDRVREISTGDLGTITSQYSILSGDGWYVQMDIYGYSMFHYDHQLEKVDTIESKLDRIIELLEQIKDRQ